VSVITTRLAVGLLVVASLLLRSQAQAAAIER